MHLAVRLNEKAKHHSRTSLLISKKIQQFVFYWYVMLIGLLGAETMQDQETYPISLQFLYYFFSGD